MEHRILRLLIVDDLEIWRYQVRLLFDAREDIVMAEAASGGEAVTKITAEDYDLVLLDIRLPAAMEGLDVLQQIKEIKPQTQVIIMTAYGDTSQVVEAMKRGAYDFVDKDDRFADLMKFKVNEFIRTAHLVADRELLIRAKYEEARRSRNAQKKGKALEDLLAALLASVEGFIEVGRNISTATEEIDIVFRNRSRDPSWQKESEIILVECKNWKSQRVGKNEFVLFKEKIENRYGRCNLGFLVCTADFAETIEKEMLRSSKTDLLVVPINGDQLRQLVESKNRSQLLRSFVDRAVLT